MNSKLLFIALVSLFFQGVMTATVTSKTEDVKAVTNGSVIPDVINGTKAEATNGSNKTEVSVGIEYTNATVNITTPLPPTKPSNQTTLKPEPTSPTTTETPAKTSSTTPAKTSSTTTTTVKPEPVPTVSTETSAKTSSTTPATVKPEPVPTATPETSVKAPSSTPATVIQNRSFDAPNFIGGIVLTLGLTAIGFVAYKFYKARKAEGNYRTLSVTSRTSSIAGLVL